MKIKKEKVTLGNVKGWVFRLFGRIITFAVVLDVHKD